MVSIKIPASRVPATHDGTLNSGEMADAQPELIEIELRNPWMAAVLAWALPGLGHIYQGRIGKGLLFFICILGTFVYGMYISNSKVVYAAVPWEQQYRWQYLCQLGVGLPATPMLWQRERALEVHQRRRLNGRQSEKAYTGFMAPPGPDLTPWKDDSGNKSLQPNELARDIVDHHPYFELGTVYTVVAGLLNILVICDAAAGPLIIVPNNKEKDSDDTKQKKKGT